MASADFCPSIASSYNVDSSRNTGTDGQTSQGKAFGFHSIYPPHLRRFGSGWHWASRFMARSPTDRRLLCDSCSSGRSFAYSFLQTPSRDDALAVRLGVPAIKVPRGLTPPSQTPCLAHHRKPLLKSSGTLIASWLTWVYLRRKSNAAFMTGRRLREVNVWKASRY